jgi:2-dehydropantoate 2-reductase
MPRFIVYGAGAVGGAVGSRLFEHGHEVVLIARGAHLEAIARAGLRFESPDGVLVQPIEVVALPEEIAWRGDDVVLLTMKGQDTAAALERLEAAAGPDVVVVCMQNGVENERAALRRFGHTYSVVVQLPATHLEPGVVVAHSSPVTGALDIGRYPDGLDDRARQIAAVFADCGFASQPRGDISRWKYAKFLRNVANAVDALFDHGDGAPEIERRAVAEAVAALDAAGIEYVGDAEYDERHRRLITTKPVVGRARGGGSSWQSLARASGVIETDQLNGEVVLLGRLHGVPTPVNELLRRLAGADARAAAPPGGHSEAEFLATLDER